MDKRDGIIIKRFERRAKKTIKTIITPYPVSGNTPLEYLFPAKGNISRVIVKADTMPKDGIRIRIVTKYEDNIETTEYKTKKLFISETNITAHVGDILSIIVEAINPEEDVSAMAAFLWVPDKKETKSENILISELDKLKENSDAEEIGKEAEGSS